MPTETAKQTAIKAAFAKARSEKATPGIVNTTAPTYGKVQKSYRDVLGTDREAGVIAPGPNSEQLRQKFGDMGTPQQKAAILAAQQREQASLTPEQQDAKAMESHNLFRAVELKKQQDYLNSPEGKRNPQLAPPVRGEYVSKLASPETIPPPPPVDVPVQKSVAGLQPPRQSVWDANNEYQKK